MAPLEECPIVILLCLFPVFGTVFIIYEAKYAGSTSILPVRFFRNRTVVGAALESFFVMLATMLAVFFLPLYFQAVKGISAQASAIRMLPFLLGMLLAVGIAATLISSVGYVKPVLILGPVFICTACGLLFTLNKNTSSARLVGYQLLLALGVGSTLDNTIVAVQGDVDPKDPASKEVAQATAIVTFSQLLGSTVGLCIASTIFTANLATFYAPDVDFDLVRNSVAAIKALPVEQQPLVIKAYVEALDRVFVVGVGAGVLAMLSGSLVRNVNVKG